MGCDVDDILCKIETLRHLKGLQDQMGKDNFTKEFPELTSLGSKLEEKIYEAKGNLATALGTCSAGMNDYVDEEGEVEEEDEDLSLDE